MPQLRAGDTKQGTTRGLAAQEQGQGPAKHPPGLPHRSPTGTRTDVRPAYLFLVPLGKPQAMIHPWGWDWQSCSPMDIAGPRTHYGWCTVGARIRPGVRARPPAPLTWLRPLLPSLLAGGTGLISIIFSRPYEFY